MQENKRLFFSEQDCVVIRVGKEVYVYINDIASLARSSQRSFSCVR